MKKKILTFVLIVVLALSVTVLCACKGDTRYPRSFRVYFETGVVGYDIEPVKVLEGYHIDKPEIATLTYPDESVTAVFCGWFGDEQFTKPWDLATTRVTENDTTLYAKWIFPTATPTEIAMGSDAFSKTITWIQDGVTSDTDFVVKLNKGNTKDITTSTGETYEQVTYPTANWITVSGNATYDSASYTVFYQIDDVLPGEHYRAEIVTTFEGGSSTTASQSNLRFKGVGSKTDPFLVYSEADLKALTTRSYDENTYAVMKGDVTISSVYAEKTGCVFDGNFNGNQKAVTLKNNSGLFYKLGEHAEVYDVDFKGAISGSNASMGVVANYNAGYVHNVDSVAVSVASDGGKVNDFNTVAQGGAGGIVGTNLATGRITACTVTSGQANVVSGKIAVGGVAGVNYGRVYNMTVSGIVGAYNGKEISSTVANSYAGTCVGVNYGEVYRVNVDGKINCRRVDLEMNKDTGATNVGGVVGYNANGATVNECLFQGMRCVGDTNVGGICGYNDGTITNCFTGRRLRKPSGTTLEERMFVSPVCGSRNVGGICGKCGEHSVISNVFSTANVWSYAMQGYTVAEKANNAIGIDRNQQPRLTSNYLGRTYGQPYSNNLLGPTGDNVLVLDNSDHVGVCDHNRLGSSPDGNGGFKADNNLIITYLRDYLGDAFGYHSTYGISLLWQSANTHPLSYYLGE